ncbi:hypothetical protein EYF80_020782 [Liparis tanakae]|uniref:Uncharacterized protein n=1 Tax=Liparis tanakae TaxID=230148 RepID=A0A4Z2HTP0_9TELE|nr:hypothetical protein EYF80_020782 [Liparis tanakae]
MGGALMSAGEAESGRLKSQSRFLSLTRGRRSGAETDGFRRQRVMITQGCVAKLAAVKWWDLAAVTTFTGLRSEISVHPVCLGQRRRLVSSSRLIFSPTGRPLKI